MTCYFRHMKKVLAEAGIEVTKENKKRIDQAIHHILGVEYKDCPNTWRRVKDILKSTDARERLINQLKEALIT